MMNVVLLPLYSFRGNTKEKERGETARKGIGKAYRTSAISHGKVWSKVEKQSSKMLVMFIPNNCT